MKKRNMIVQGVGGARQGLIRGDMAPSERVSQLTADDLLPAQESRIPGGHAREGIGIFAHSNLGETEKAQEPTVCHPDVVIQARIDGRHGILYCVYGGGSR